MLALSLRAVSLIFRFNSLRPANPLCLGNALLERVT